MTNEREGAIYVLQFANGEVKVGKSVQPAVRFRAHAEAAKARGTSVREQWVSRSHIEWQHNEKLLIDFCVAHFGEPVVGKETFAADYLTVVEYASSLPFNGTLADISKKGSGPDNTTFRTRPSTNRTVRAAIGRAVADRGGQSVTADEAIAAAFQLAGQHWQEYLDLLPKKS